MTNDIIEQAKRALELASKATPGSWEQRCDNTLDNMALPKCVWSDLGWISKGGTLPKQYSVPDAEFIAASRELMPKLAVAVLDLEAKLDSANAKLVIAEEALEFYANGRGFHTSQCRERKENSHLKPTAFTLNPIGFKAREALQKIRGEK